LAELVRRTLELNGFNDRALTLAKAVSDQPGQIVQLVVPQGNTGHASIRDHASATDEIMEVETVSVDQLTAEWPQVDFIKIDVEGAEEAVWQGMRETIRRNKDIVIVLEFGPTRYVNPKAFLEAILAEGFILRYIDYDTQPKEISIDRCLSERQSDYWDLFLSRS
jgi:FkbM family methyltransferase